MGDPVFVALRIRASVLQTVGLRFVLTLQNAVSGELRADQPWMWNTGNNRLQCLLRATYHPDA